MGVSFGWMARSGIYVGDARANRVRRTSCDEMNHFKVLLCGAPGVQGT